MMSRKNQNPFFHLVPPCKVQKLLKLVALDKFRVFQNDVKQQSMLECKYALTMVMRQNLTQI